MSSALPELPMIHISDLRKTYVMGDQEVRALDGIQLEIGRGEFVAIMGPSGSGKSTLMHIIGCLDVPTSGSYLLDGIEVADMDEYELAHIRNRKIGFVFQGFNLLARTSALDNVELPMVYAKRKDRTERAIAALERVGLGSRLDHTSNQLSGGQQQRVAIARAFATQPKLLLADEPTGNLDSATGAQIIELLFELNREQGTTLILVTHDNALAARCTRKIVLDAGAIVNT